MISAHLRAPARLAPRAEHSRHPAPGCARPPSFPPPPAPQAPPPPRRAVRARSSNIAPDGTFDVDSLDVDSLELDDPFGIVGDVMTTGALRCATPDQPLSSAASKLDKVTGLAVVDDANVVVGVVSIKVGGAKNKSSRSGLPRLLGPI
jgi:CBS domain-containing protein